MKNSMTDTRFSLRKKQCVRTFPTSRIKKFEKHVSVPFLIPYVDLFVSEHIKLLNLEMYATI